MTTLELFTAIQHSDFSHAIGGLNHLAGAVAQVGHITGLILLLSSLVLVNLRLLGFGLTGQPVSKLALSTRKFVWVGLALLIISGLFIFIPAATIYYVNRFFWYKAILLTLAIIVQFSLFQWVTTAENPKPIVAKSIALLSLGLWFGVGACARIIGYLN
jgi:uncharacterized membrane protein YcfT